jgi:hypothetical protein
MTGQAMHVSIDLGFHKLIIVPPSSSMVTKTLGLTPLHQTTLLKSEPHKESSTLTGLGCGATPWVLWDQNGHGSWVFLSHFPISHASWLLPIFFELLCRSLLREQCQNPRFSVEWRAEMSWKCWSSLNMEGQLLCHVWEDGSYCSSHY